MIPIPLSVAVLLYLMFALCGIFWLWLIFERSDPFKKYNLEHKEVWECEICAYTYVDSTHDSLSRCPQCNSFNKKA